MDVFARIKAAGGEVVSNRAIANVGGARVVIARVVDGQMALTAEGVELLKTVNNEPKKAPAKQKKTSKGASADGDN
jgi:hypothetical protein